ncbi:MAG: hypothetical protein HZB46_12120 [Solirubrobacterales bacterium]|nr:hypothetical protein [Solirubrobacterales bacterium]
MTPTNHLRTTAAAMAALLTSAVLTPVAYGATAAARQKPPRCAAGKVAVQRKKRVRVAKKIKVHGKKRTKKVWTTKKVWVCVAAPALKDTKAPTAPAGVDAAAGNGQVALVWSPSRDDVGVAGYRVFRDGQLVASPAATQHTDAGLANGQSYTYGIAAVDAAGNQSPVSTIVATPRSSRDTTAPSAPSGFTAAASSKQVQLSWDAASDDVGVVFYELRRDGTPIAFQEGRTFTDESLVNGTTYRRRATTSASPATASTAAARSSPRPRRPTTWTPA